MTKTRTRASFSEFGGKANASDRNAIAERIRRDITSGALSFGERIPESRYADAFGVSRTPVREALMMLVSLELVDVRPKHGTFVTSFTRTRLREIFDVRYLLESGGVALANPYQRSKLLLELERVLALIEETAEADHQHDANHDHDTDFHRLLVQASGNELMVKTYKPIEVCLLAARCRFQRTEWVWKTAARHHTNIVEAVRADDMPAFQRALREHLDWSRDALMDAEGLFTSPG